MVFLTVFIAALLQVEIVYAEDAAIPEVSEGTTEGEADQEQDAPNQITPIPEEGEILSDDPAAEIPSYELTDDPDSTGQSEAADMPAADAAETLLQAPSEPEIIEVGETIELDSALTDLSAGDQEVEVVITNGDGQVLDLASQEGLEVMASADPWWMVGTLKYAFIKTGGTCPSDAFYCGTSTTPIKSALAYMDANTLVPTDGILHVEPDTYSEGTITIDGSSGNGNLAQLKGLISSGTSSDTQLVANIEISHTLLGFTLSGFTITGSLEIYDNLGTLTLYDLKVTNASGSGIQVSGHNGAVNVTNVESSHNKNYGMTIDNTAGTLGVTITNSEISHNNDSNASYYWGGLFVSSRGVITLNGVAACDNDGSGATLDAVKGTVIKNSVFNGNLAVPLAGGVGYGLNINNTYTTNNISLENVQADNNTNYGMYIVSAASVSLKNVNVNDNGSSSYCQGVFINIQDGSGAVTVTNSTFRNNGDTGLRILSHKNVVLNGVTASENGANGVYIDNCDYDGASCVGTGTVSITGNLPNYFNDNLQNGLQVVSGGSVTLSNFQADRNIYSGVSLANNYSGRSGNVTLNATYKPAVGTWTNSASDNSQNGLRVDSFGNISLDKCQFDGNSSNGAVLVNNYAVSAKSVTVKNSRLSENTSFGLLVDSKGNVVIYNVDAYANVSQSGMGIYNFYGSGNVTISGIGTVKNNLSGNFYYGIEINSAGIVAVSNVDASNNAYGISIDNSNGVAKSVTIKNVDCSGSASSEGLFVYSKGAVTVMDIISNENVSGPGATLRNDIAATPQNVSITRGQFSDNASSIGFQVYSKGNITLTSVQADRNNSSGSWLDTCIYNGGFDRCDGSGGVMINGSDNSFSDNGGYGLYIESRNNISLSNVIIDNNLWTGLNISHNYSNCIGTVNLTSTSGNRNSISNNGYYGIYAPSMGIISLANFDANNNISNGVYLSNSSSTLAKNVTITNATINHNQNTGLVIYSKGLVTLTGVEIVDSSKHYWEIDDDLGNNVHDRLPYEQLYDEVWWFTGTNGQSVTIDLVSPDFNAYVELYDSVWHLLDADDDSGGGTDAQITYSLPSSQIYYILVRSVDDGGYGDYTLSINGSSPYNLYTYYYGANISNNYGNADIKVNNSAALGYGLNVRDNNYEGLYVYSKGNVSLNGVKALYNGGYSGVEIYNSDVDNKSISLVNCIFDDNDDRGLMIESNGAISWSGGSASGNIGDYGARLDNDSASSAKTITVSNVSSNGNETSGLLIYSLGKITLTNVSASNNVSGSGAILDNCRYDGSIPGCKGSGDVIVSGSYGKLEFNDNNYYGLKIDSRGVISLSNVNASGNNIQDGVNLNNAYQNATAGITVKATSTLTPSNFSDNWAYGLAIWTNGSVSLANLNALGNVTNSGIYVSNSTATQPTLITHVKTGSNGNRGLQIETLGVITLDYVEDIGGNTNSGIWLVNSSASTAQAITVNRTHSSDNTNGYGLFIEATGLVTLNHVVTSGNRYGTDVANNVTGSAIGVKILSTYGENTFDENTYEGLTIYSNGDVTLSKVNANRNGYQGIYVNTRGKLTAVAVTTFRNNRDGFYVVADNGVSINGLQSYNNGISSNYDGLHIVVSVGSPVSILNSVIIGNYGDGIEIVGNTTPILTGTFFYGNDINNVGGDKNLNFH
jgi:hypothetical protein